MAQALGDGPLHLLEGLTLLGLSQQRHKATGQRNQQQSRQEQADQTHLTAEELLAQARLGGHQGEQSPRENAQQVGGKQQGCSPGWFPLLKRQQQAQDTDRRH